MDIRYVGKNITLTEGIKDHLQDKLLRLEKYSKRLIESHIVLKKEKYLYDAQITLLAKNFRAYGEAKRKDNIYAAIDMACHRVEKQLKKFREKVKDHHKAHGPGAVPIKVKTARAILDEGDSGATRPKIVKKKSFAAKPMSSEEASLQLQLSPEDFLVFLNAKTQRVNVIHKLKNGNHGLIEPSF